MQFMLIMVFLYSSPTTACFNSTVISPTHTYVNRERTAVNDARTIVNRERTTVSCAC